MTFAFTTPVALPTQKKIELHVSPRTTPRTKWMPSVMPWRATLQKPSPSQSSPMTVSAPSPAALSTFKDFFSLMPGSWNSERTYHYITPGQQQTREESQTTFDVERITPEQIEAVLASNKSFGGSSSEAEGFRVSFLTRMASQDELVRSGTNLAFIPESGSATTVEGSYYRDLGYEDSGPVKSRFVFNAEQKQLQMTTFYTKVVSVDEIRLINDGLRLRRIINYRRPKNDSDPLVDPMLVGYGVECKGDMQRLVE